MTNLQQGIVRAISLDRTKMTVAMPRGGSFECNNNGFEIGQSVAFLLDVLGKRVVKVWPKEVAEMHRLIGSAPELQEAIAADEAWEEIATYDPAYDGSLDEIMDDIENVLMEEIGDDDYSKRSDIAEEIDRISPQDGDIPEGDEDLSWPDNLYDT